MKKRSSEHRPLSSSSSSSMGLDQISMTNPGLQPKEGAGMDELLAVLGYEVRSSDMAEVAQMLEHLDVATGSNALEAESLLSHLSTETVHYNPSNLSSWVESMLSELNPQFDSSASSIASQIYDEPSSSNYDLSAVVYGERDKKRIKHHHHQQQQPQQQQQILVSDSCSSSIGSIGSTTRVLQTEPTPTPTPTRPVVLIDSQETGIRLVHTLMACAEAIQQDNLAIADALVQQIGPLAVSQSRAMRKVATYFAEALARRIYNFNTNPNPNPNRTQSLNSSSFDEALQIHFYQTCPYFKFAHFTSNQAILEAFAGISRVHIIDFGIKQGMQWPPLIQALATRAGGPPSIRLTGIGPPRSDSPGSDGSDHIGWKLGQFAETLRVDFKFERVVVNSLAELDSEALRLREGESVAVNSVFDLHELLARPGSVEKVLELVREVRPRIVTVVEQEANHNGPVFLDRFNEALHYYSTVFDSLESCGGGSDGQDLLMSEMYLGNQICNVVACEGADRVERHETMAQWKTRFLSAGFAPVHLGSSGFKQGSALVSLVGGGDGYRVEESNGCLTLGWYTRPLIATSAWQLGSN